MFLEGSPVPAESKTVGHETVAVTAVVVAYYPEVETLRRMLVALAPQVQAICIVDNSADDGRRLDEAVGDIDVHTIRLGRNYGIGHAQNVGIHWAMDRGATHVLLMDQDSVPAQDMVRHLVSAVLACASPAGVGPRVRDPRSGHVDAFVRIEGLRRKKIQCSCEECVVEVDHLIASGCLIPASVLRAVGLMRAELFIDYVDIEWALRARKFGYRSYGVCGARMDHSLGDSRLRLGSLQIPTHSPLRHYYQVRNTVLFLRESTAFLAWRILDVRRLLEMLTIYGMVRAPRLVHARMMGLGLWHGLFGRTGSYEEACAGSGGRARRHAAARTD